MYRLEEIQDALLHVVGWEQSYDPAKAIDDNLTQTESGLTFQGAHPLVTLDNVRAIVPDDFVFQYPVWNMIREYKAGAKVRHNNKVWIAARDNQNEEPTESDFNDDYNDDYGNPYWQPYNFISDYLERLTRNGIAQMVQTFTQIKGLDKETKNLLERRTFFDGAGRIRATLPNNHKLVGFEIVPVRSMGVTMKIEQIGLQMTGATGVVRMYLFHSSQIDPIKTFDLNFTQTNGGFQWFPLKDCYLPYISTGNNAGGACSFVTTKTICPPGCRQLT